MRERPGSDLPERGDGAAEHHDGYGGNEREKEPRENHGDGDGLGPARARGEPVETRQRVRFLGSGHRPVEEPFDPGEPRLPRTLRRRRNGRQLPTQAAVVNGWALARRPLDGAKQIPVPFRT